jgi:5'-3' exonuclease
MGIRGLQSYIRQYSSPRTLEFLLDPKQKGLAIGIDISFYMYRWQADIERIVEFLKKLQSNGHHILLAFDGRAEDGKQWEAQRRREIRDQETKSADALAELLKDPNLCENERFLIEQRLAEHQRKGWTLTREMRLAIKERLYIEKFPIVKAKGEADGFLAAASYIGDLDIVISGDMDLIAMGAQIMWAPVEDGTNFNEYRRDTILQELKMSDWQFRSMCAICFTETSLEQNPFPIQQAHQLLKVFRSLDKLKEKYPNHLKVWPDETHIFYRPVDSAIPWLRDDQEPIYKAFLNRQPMEYT